MSVRRRMAGRPGIVSDVARNASIMVAPSSRPAMLFHDGLPPVRIHGRRSVGGPHLAHPQRAVFGTGGGQHRARHLLEGHLAAQLVELSRHETLVLGEVRRPPAGSTAPAW